ncbi:hypothetical protein [Taklimakanibacter deserti]|uniref:hypothetical protein n=1 Tax=Taklimakanibacter deserti TaxID=2267839 RepID=UPI000E64B4A8
MEKLPPPVLAFAQQFDKECRDNGLGRLTVSENYSDDGRGEADVNADGQKDYFVYKCMFGCSRDPFAFTGKSSPCPWGSLLLSKPEGYDQVFLPGRVSRLAAGLPVKISIKRPRALRDFCEDPSYDPEYVYQLKEGRFQLLGMCSPNATTDCLASSGL